LQDNGYIQSSVALQN